MPRWVGTRGYEVELIWLDRRPVLRVCQRVETRLYVLAYCTTVDAVAELVDLADLVEVVELRREGPRPYHRRLCIVPRWQ